MASTASLSITVTPLGALSSGTFQPSLYGATQAQVAAGAAIIGDARAYKAANVSPRERGVSCMDDRLSDLLRLAGGGVSLALMKNFLFGGELLSEDLRWLKDNGFYVLLHDDCGALAKLMAIVARLADVHAAGYKLLEADGIVVEMGLREEIAKWAAALNPDYADTDAAKEVAHQVQPVEGGHVAGYLAIIDQPDVTLGMADEITRASTLKTLVITTWAADKAASELTEDAAAQERAAMLAKVFSAETALVLGGPEMLAALVRRG